MTLGMTQIDATKLLKTRGIEQIKDAIVVEDDAIIVKQDPKFTMEMINQKQVKTFGVTDDKIVYVEISDLAPKSSWYFQKITGLLDSPVGSLDVLFAFPGMKVIMFKGNQRESKNLIPENIPIKCVEAGQIGVTNMSRRQIGPIGVDLRITMNLDLHGEPFPVQI